MEQANEASKIETALDLADKGLSEKINIALDKEFMQQWFNRQLLGKSSLNKATKIELESAEITHYKKGRRYLIEYRCKVHGRSVSKIEYFIGKIRAKHSARSMFIFMRSLWKTHFGMASEDNIYIPEPLGYIRECNIWLQRKVNGDNAASLLFSDYPDKVKLGTQIAKAAFKINKFGSEVVKTHGITQELSVLENYFNKLSKIDPSLKHRLDQLLEKGKNISQHLLINEHGMIHRDFHPDQIIVDGEKIFLLDFDLYCNGDVSLDIGNFIAHLIEQTLREKLSSYDLSAIELSIVEQYLSDAGEQYRLDIQIYITLSLMRHVYISTLFSDRRRYCSDILNLCEERLMTLH